MSTTETSKRRRSDRYTSPGYDSGSDREHDSKSRKKSNRDHKSSSRDDEKSRRSKSEKKSKRREERSNDEDESEDDDQAKRHGQRKLSEDDYFAKSTEFQTWLRLEKKQYFEELSGKEARSLFEKVCMGTSREFVKRWNRGKLDKKYYEGIASSEVPAADRTKHQWKFKNLAQEELVSARDSVDSLTQSSQLFNRPMTREEAKSNAIAARARTALERDNDLDRQEDDRNRQRRENRDMRKNNEVVMDELLPKATGREAQIEKRRAQNAYHKQERDVDVELNDADLLGGGSRGAGDTSLESVRRQQARREERRNAFRDEKASAMAGKVQAYAAKEDATMAMFKQMAQNRFGGGGGPS
ncbi:uncharacterized protein EV422DRAFT_565922 [Fimicolochytrium jonesii]|uniref:uncharacterized protein n=1 Tax=Fimicolochytrium jonesii TaxID=1396493 RepID=UPI0022FDCAA4|nr:uncharacterized protein EV422DRAFT_565922 [Fimicolochytrium jonesii]KAI8823060.1 hypothetical protein EV422DRAFT_565922 [Fimicolochytrium jonesii]